MFAIEMLPSVLAGSLEEELKKPMNVILFQGTTPSRIPCVFIYPQGFPHMSINEIKKAFIKVMARYQFSFSVMTNSNPGRTFRYKANVYGKEVFVCLLTDTTIKDCLEELVYALF